MVLMENVVIVTASVLQAQKMRCISLCQRLSLVTYARTQTDQRLIGRNANVGDICSVWLMSTAF